MSYELTKPIKAAKDDSFTRLAHEAIAAKKCNSVESYIGEHWPDIRAMVVAGVGLAKMAGLIKVTMGRGSLSPNTLLKAIRSVGTIKQDEEVLARYRSITSVSRSQVGAQAIAREPRPRPLQHQIPSAQSPPIIAPQQHAQGSEPQPPTCHACGSAMRFLPAVKSLFSPAVSIWACTEPRCSGAFCKNHKIWLCPVCRGFTEKTADKHVLRCENPKCTGRVNLQLVLKAS